MAHTYASVAVFNDFLRDGGSTTFATEASTIVARKLAILEAVSLVVDEWCDRSRFGSGFGPRTGTNRYDGDGTDLLVLSDDLLSITSVAVLAGTGGGSTTYTDETDFYKEPYDRAPYRRLRCHALTGNAVWDWGRRTVSVAGSWGYQSVTRTASATTNEAMDTSETGLDVSAAAEFSPGQTILVGAEQMYVTSLSGTTLTVRRGHNGTTAASSSLGAAISIYEYPTGVVDASLQIAHRRWAGRGSGADGSDGGGEMPPVRTQRPNAAELSILSSTVRHLRFTAVG